MKEPLVSIHIQTVFNENIGKLLIHHDSLLLAHLQILFFACVFYIQCLP
jgi:hypothetical protein